LGILASLMLGGAMAQMPVIEERSRQLVATPLAGASWERYSLIRVPVPSRPPEHALYRLRVASEAGWLDGARLLPAEDGEFDLLNLHPKRDSVVIVAGWIASAVLIETPRVFISRHEISARGVRLWVRNSLDNTANVYVRVTGEEGSEVAASATVPPGNTQIVTLPPLPGMSRPPWRIELEKQEEAMEGAYRFVRVVERSTGQL
jgi:hypothetical protein